MMYRTIILSTALLSFGMTAAAADGESVYDKSCKLCHSSGLAGAPKLGDKAAWKERLSKGAGTLEQHAISGFKGSSGTMPPKGGNPKLSDADIRAAVAFMIKSAK